MLSLLFDFEPLSCRLANTLHVPSSEFVCFVVSPPYSPNNCVCLTAFLVGQCLLKGRSATFLAGCQTQCINKPLWRGGENRQTQKAGSKWTALIRGLPWDSASKC